MKMWLENLNNMEKSTSNIAVVKPTQVTHSPKNTSLHKSAERLVIPSCIQHLLLELSYLLIINLSLLRRQLVCSHRLLSCMSGGHQAEFPARAHASQNHLNEHFCHAKFFNREPNQNFSKTIHQSVACFL